MHFKTRLKRPVGTACDDEDQAPIRQRVPRPSRQDPAIFPAQGRARHIAPRLARLDRVHELDRAGQAGERYGAPSLAPEISPDLAVTVAALVDVSEPDPRHHTPSQLGV